MPKKIIKSKQPKIPKGKTFLGYAVFNWGLPIRVYRSAKMARNSCCTEGRTWKEAKEYFKVEKVKCIVI